MPTRPKSDSKIPADIPWSKRIFSLRDAAAHIGISESTATDEIKRGKLKTFKAGRVHRITGAMLDDYTSAVTS